MWRRPRNRRHTRSRRIVEQVDLVTKFSNDDNVRFQLQQMTKLSFLINNNLNISYAYICGEYAAVVVTVL